MYSSEDFLLTEDPSIIFIVIIQMVYENFLIISDSSNLELYTLKFGKSLYHLPKGNHC